MRVWLPYDSADQARARLAPVPANIHIDVFSGTKPPPGPDEVFFLALPNDPVRELMKRVMRWPLPRLRWVQLASAGYEHIVDLVPGHLGVCNAAGVHDAGTAELAVGLAIAHLRGIDHYAMDRRSDVFDPQIGDSLADKRILIVGYGHVGAAIERRLAGFEVASVTRVARRAKADPMVHSSVALPHLVGDADVIFLAVPGDASTRHLVDAGLLSKMHDGTLIVNVGRGVLLDLDALLAEDGRIHAAVDVTDPEPLTPGHPLWHAKYVTWTPHVGGRTTAFIPRYDRLLRTQLGKLALNQPLLNVIRKPT